MFFQGFLARLRHAFALPEPVTEVPQALESLIDPLCAEIHRRHLTTPALLLLESGVPLQHVASQMCVFAAPLLSAIGQERRAQELAAFLERPGAIETLCRRLESFQQVQR